MLWKNFHTLPNSDPPILQPRKKGLWLLKNRLFPSYLFVFYGIGDPKRCALASTHNTRLTISNNFQPYSQIFMRKNEKLITSNKLLNQFIPARLTAPARLF